MLLLPSALRIFPLPLPNGVLPGCYHPIWRVHKSVLRRNCTPVGLRDLPLTFLRRSLGLALISIFWATLKPASPSSWTTRMTKPPTFDPKASAFRGLNMMRDKTCRLSFGVAHQNELKHQDPLGGCQRISQR